MTGKFLRITESGSKGKSCSTTTDIRNFRVSYTLAGWDLTGYVKSFLTDPYN
jgi:hypothetical protein